MKKAKGTFWMRSAIVLLAAFFGVLVYWSVGFLLDDIPVIRRPDRSLFFEENIDHSLDEKLAGLEMQLQELEHRHELLRQQRGFIKDSSSSLKITVDNLFKLKNRDQQLISGGQFDRVLESLDKIIVIQEDFKTTADRYIAITNEKYEVQKQIAAVKRRMEDNRTAVSKLYSEALQRHRVKTAVVKMLFLIPLVAACTWLVVKKRGSIYRMIYASTALSVYIKTSLVAHDYFPTRYFKYIIVLVMLILVGYGFVWLIRRLVKPRIEALLKQYREAYERFLCPVCEYPIRRGPRKYLYWTRRTVHKIALKGGVSPTGDEVDEPYTCPACGTRLFGKCESCGNICHTLLPNCRTCGASRSITGEQY